MGLQKQWENGFGGNEYYYIYEAWTITKITGYVYLNAIRGKKEFRYFVFEFAAA